MKVIFAQLYSLMINRIAAFIVGLTLAIVVTSQTTPQIDAVGGGFEETLEEIPMPENLEPTPVVSVSNDGVWDINDSLLLIPAYDVYCKWDTRNIHAYDFDYKQLTDTVPMILRYESCDYANPFQGRVTSNFGHRNNKYHYGIDIKLYKGDPVVSAFEGVVRVAKYSSSYGNVVVVRHNNGLETLYAHLSARKVKPGDHVEAGQVLGLGGNTGRSTGSHLHFECRYKGEPINPNDLIDWEKGELKTDTLLLNASHFRYLKEARAKKYHRIRSGETLSSIARRYGTSVGTICRLNGMSRNSTIYAGRTVRVR